MTRLHRQKFWVYDGVNPYMSEILHMSLNLRVNEQTTRRFLTELHRRYELSSVEFLVEDADYPGYVLADEGYQF